MYCVTVFIQLQLHISLLTNIILQCDTFFTIMVTYFDSLQIQFYQLLQSYNCNFSAMISSHIRHPSILKLFKTNVYMRTRACNVTELNVFFSFLFKPHQGFLAVTLCVRVCVCLSVC